MKPTKSVYWMTTIILSYSFVLALASGIVLSVLGLWTNLIIEPAVRGLFIVAGIYLASRHINKKSLVPMASVIKVSISVGVALFAFGALISFVGGGEMAATLVVLIVITTVVSTCATYFFLKKIAA